LRHSEPMTPFQILDALLITPFRLLPNPEAAFLFGIIVLALGSAAIGKAGAALVSRAQRTRWNTESAESTKRQDLSVQALRQGDKKAYQAQNMLAQEAYTNTLALSAGRAAALIWPACAVLTWLYWRFDGVPMPFLWSDAGPATYFLPAFIAALWGSSRLMGAKKAAPPADAGSATKNSPS